MDELWSSPCSAQEAASSGGAGIAKMTSGAALTLVMVTQALAEMVVCCRKGLLSLLLLWKQKYSLYFGGDGLKAERRDGSSGRSRASLSEEASSHAFGPAE